MTAVILAGGMGTRLKPFTMTIPKPLLPLGDMPILEVVMRQLEEAGFRRIVLTLGHMAHLFTAVIGDRTRWKADIEFCLEDSPLGTAGGLRLIKNLPEDFLVMNGDLLTTINYAELMAEHRESKSWGTIGMNQREVRIDYGVVVPTPEGTLGEYREKPTLTYEVSMGINAISARSIEYIPVEGRFDMPDLFRALQRAGKKVSCRSFDCYWRDIGRFDDYTEASRDFTENPGKFLPAR